MPLIYSAEAQEHLCLTCPVVKFSVEQVTTDCVGCIVVFAVYYIKFINVWFDYCFAQYRTTSVFIFADTL